MVMRCARELLLLRWGGERERETGLIVKLYRLLTADPTTN